MEMSFAPSAGPSPAVRPAQPHAVTGGAFCPEWAVALLIVLAAVDAVWLAATPLSLAREGLASAAGSMLLGLIACLCAGRIDARPPFRGLLSGAGFMLIAWPVLRLFNHLVMTTAFPLADPRLAAWDAALGLEWTAYIFWLDRHPALIEAMSWTYHNLTTYSCITFVLIVFAAGVERAREFVLIFLLTAVVASVVGMFFPALGGMAYYAPDPGLMQTFGPTVGTYHLEVLASLRGNEAHVLRIDALPGLTTFPSFHTAMGVVSIYCVRGSRLLFLPLLVVNGLMIASTPLFGSHYFVDLAAGTVLALGSAFLLRLIDGYGGPVEAASGESAPLAATQPA